MNVLTIDVEEWFQFFEDLDSGERYKNYEVRIYENVDRILGLLEQKNAKATFFVVGWIAKRYPDIIKRIAKNYEIGSHSMNHKLVSGLNRSEFREEVYSSSALLEDAIGKRVEAFRAPGFSIGKNELWALEVLLEQGFRMDSSILPFTLGSNFECKSPFIIELNGLRLKEFPVSYKKFLCKGFILSGGGYFRLFPYNLIKTWSKQTDYLLSYIHPRDLDSTQPRIKNLSPIQTFRSYFGIKSSQKKFELWLRDFDFIDLNTADKIVDWDNARVIKLTS